MVKNRPVDGFECRLGALCAPGAVRGSSKELHFSKNTWIFGNNRQISAIYLHFGNLSNLISRRNFFSIGFRDGCSFDAPSKRSNAVEVAAIIVKNAVVPLDNKVGILVYLSLYIVHLFSLDAQAAVDRF